MARLALCMAGLLLALVLAEAQTYTSPPTTYYSPPLPTTQTPPSASLPKKQTPPPAKKQTPPPQPPKKHTPPPPPAKKHTPPPPPAKKHTPPPPPAKKHTPPPPPAKKHTPPPPPAKKHTPPPPYTPTWPSPPPPVVATPPTYTPTWPSPPPPMVATPPTYTPTWPSPSPPPTVVPTPATPTWPSSPPPPVVVPTPATPTWPSSPPPASAVAAKKVRCKNRSYSTCYFREFTCPADCPYSCEVDCHTCGPVCNCNKPGAVCQDPRFIGADGITFYFHGKKDQHFCLVTDSNLQINAHFIGKRNTNMGRDFTWVQSLGILFDDHQLYIGAKKTGAWNDADDRLALSFDGQPIFLSETDSATWRYSPAGVTITRTKDTNMVVVEVEGKFKIKAAVVPITEKESLIHNYGITQEDCFAHLDLSFKFNSLSQDVSGVLGQTYATSYVSQIKMGVSMPVVGGERKFSTSSLFATDCAVSRFVGENSVNDNNVEFGDLNCATGISGRGVVCKR